MTDSLIEEAISSLTDEKASQAIFKELQQGNSNWFFEDQLRKVLIRNNITYNYLENDEASDSQNSTLVFEYRVLKMSIKYKQLENFNRAKRITEVGFFLRIIQEATGRVLLSKTFEALKEGWFDPIQVIPKESKVVQAQPNQANQKSGSILQPILISSITGTIVYLFYTLRSR